MPATLPALPIQTPSDGANRHGMRRAPRASDEAVNGTTRRWLRALPPRRRPLRLCAQFPRLANRIAWHWSDVERCTDVLEDLLTDSRGGRRGFPVPVARELRMLCEFHMQQRLELKPEGIWARAVRVSGVR